MMKKSISILLVLVMIVGVFSIIPFSVRAETELINNEASIWQGTGTEDDPYQIYSLSDFEALRDQVDSGNSYEGKFFSLMNNIVMNNQDAFIYDENGIIVGVSDNADIYQWNPIGGYSKSFSGTFDGKENEVIGLYVNGSLGEDEYNCGLFANLNHGKVTNLSTVDGYVYGGYSVGGLIGTSGNSVVTNCYNTCTVDGKGRTGGIVGNCVIGSISGCYNSGKIRGGSYTGGVAGEASGASSGDHITIEACYNIGNVHGTESVGGIVGNVAVAYSGGYVSNCYNRGEVIGNEKVGGIAGGADNISSCYNMGTVTGGTKVGGILGSSGNGGVTNSYNLGDIFGNETVGGIVGDLNVRGGHFEIITSYNIGELLCNGSYCGGILGYIYSSIGTPYPFNPLIIQNCYYIESTDLCNVGGMNNDTSRTGTRTINNVIALSDDQMQRAESFSGFDFETIWTMDAPGYEYPALQSLLDTYVEAFDLSVSVLSPDGTAMDSGYTVNWYEKDSDKVIGKGKTLNVVDTEKEYQLEVVLSEELSYLYKQPERRDVVISDNDQTINVHLERLKAVTVTGKICDKEDHPLSGAVVTFKQTFNGKYQKDMVVNADENGGFTVEIANVPTEAVISADGYYSRTRTIILTETNDNSIELGAAALTKLPENKITLHLTKVIASLPEEASTTEELLSANSLSFTLYNQTKNKAVSEYIVQYPYIYFENSEVDAGDSILIGITDNNQQMAAAQKTVKLDAQKTASCSIEFTENGRFTIPSVNGNEADILMLFDGSRRFICSESAASNYLSKPLAEGSYTAVFMQKTDLLRSVSTIDKLAEFGLAESTDYTVKNISVLDGVITDVGTINIPALDESKLYYTVPENTLFTTNSVSAPVGKYIVMRCAYKINHQYAAENETITFELPDDVDFIGGSLTLDGKLTACSKDGNTVEVHTNKESGIVRFYTVATAKGQKNINASLSFELGNSTVTQPIGTATFTAESGKIVLPEKTGQTRVTATGTTLADSVVTLYDNDTEVGTTRANKAGKWRLAFDLIKPYSYSFHDVYVKIENDRIEKEILTDPQIICYDKSCIEVSKVTMINTAHPASSLTPVEFVTVFDFLNPSNTVPSYNYWPNYPTFTFKVEFTGGDDTVLSDVYVVTTDNSGTETYVPVSYDKSTELWIGTYEYASTVEIPASLWINYDVDELQLLTNSYIIDEKYVEDVNCVLDGLSENLINNEESIEAVVVEENEKFYVLKLIDSKTSSIIAYTTIVDCNYEDFCNNNDLLYVSVDDSNEWKCGVKEENGAIWYYMKNENERLAFMYIVLPYISVELNGKKNDLVPTGYSVPKDEVDVAFDYVGHMGEIVEIDAPGSKNYYSEVADIKNALDLVYDTFGYYNMKKHIDNTKTDQLDRINSLRLLLNAKCSDGSYKLDPSNMSKYAKCIDALYDYAVIQMNCVLDSLENFKKTILTSCAKTLATMGINVCLEKAVKISKTIGTNGYKFSEATRKRIQQINKGYNSTVAIVGSAKLNCDRYNDMLSSLEFSSDINISSISITNNEIKAFLDRLSLESTIDIESIRSLFSGTDGQIRRNIETIRQSILGSYKKCNNPSEQLPVPSPSNQSPKSPVTPIVDPSGYVYEAVPSNRLEGVKVEAYYCDYATDEFGIPEDNKSDILWDAENYDQVNPLYTDVNGQYAWDVPTGQWLVKFSKDGYYDTDSKLLNMVDADGYLPVPPPQTEVNVGMVSKDAPVVDEVSIYDSEIRIAFSQYMQIDSVNNNTVTVRMNGKEVSGSLKPINAEYDYENVHQYASVFSFVPTDPISGNISVTVNGATNYAGTQMTEKFSQSNRVAIKPESITVNDSISVTYNSGALLEVQVAPAEAGAGLTLEAVSSSPSIVGIANNSIVLDENGHGNIMLEGKLPGQGEIAITLKGTDLTKTVKANVAGVVPVSDRCEKVKANIVSGSTVEAGTLVKLTTETEGAEIYYTLDGTCPCTIDSPSRLKYSGPIRIDENTFIIAYAVKDGMQESYTAGFNYFVPIPVKDKLLGDVDGDGTVTIIDATFIQRELASIPIPFVMDEIIADTDEDGVLSIIDATFIQRWLASLKSNDNIGKRVNQ